jgi:hypothetical protein
MKTAFLLPSFWSSYLFSPPLSFLSRFSTPLQTCFAHKSRILEIYLGAFPVGKKS